MAGEIYIGEGEPDVISINHPLPFFDGRSDLIELPASSTPEERIWRFCDANRLGAYYKTIFTALFPEGLRIDDVFDLKGMLQSEETKLTDQDKAVRWELLRYLGFESPRKTERQDSSFIPQLHVAFTLGKHALTTQINRLPMMKRLENINQTSLMPGKTRADHTKHLMMIVAKDVLRFALQTPELFIEKVTHDMNEYSQHYNHEHPNKEQAVFSLNPTTDVRSMVGQAFEKAYGSLDETSPEKKQALQLAVEYLKYILLDVAAHDAETPGWGDIFMKTWGYSEDRKLAEKIEVMVTKEYTGLPHLLANENMDARLLAAIIRSTALDGDTCLPGLLFKDKRAIQQTDKDHKHLAIGPSLDRDRESGTITDSDTMINNILPGGFRHVRKDEEKPQLSFEARAMIFFYGLLGGLDAEEMRNSLTQLFRGTNINVDLIYIAAEEVSFSQNQSLMKVPFPKSGTADTDNMETVEEIMPVALVPGDIKKALLMSNFLYLGYFHGESREGIERIVGDMISGGKEQGYIRENMFVGRTDYEASNRLEEVAPIIPWLMYNLRRQARIVTEKELYDLSKDGKLPKGFIREIKMENIVQFKPGTMMRMEERGNMIVPASVGLAHKRGQQLDDPVDPLSLMGRLLQVKEALLGSKLFAIIDLDDAQIKEINELLNEVPENRDALTQILSQWSETLVINKTRFDSVLPYTKR